MSGQTRVILGDVQELVRKEIFCDALACDLDEWFQDDMGQDCVFHSIPSSARPRC